MGSTQSRKKRLTSNTAAWWLLMAGFKLTQVIFWLGLSIYCGGIFLIGPIVASQVFSTIRGAGAPATPIGSHPDPATELAGNVFGNILHLFNMVELICLPLILIPIVIQMALYMYVWDIWLWLRLALVMILVIVAVQDIFLLSPKIRSVHDQWIKNIDANPDLAAQNQSLFKTLHARAELNGKIKAVLLLLILIVSAWGITYPTRQEYVQQIIMQSSGEAPVGLDQQMKNP
jgi:hypothetical protein